MKASMVAKLKAKIKKLRADIEGCRGYGMCESDFDQMRRLGDEMKGVKYALRVIQRSMR